MKQGEPSGRHEDIPAPWDETLELFKPDEDIQVRLDGQLVGSISVDDVREHFANPEVQATRERARELGERLKAEQEQAGS